MGEHSTMTTERRTEAFSASRRARTTGWPRFASTSRRARTARWLRFASTSGRPRTARWLRRAPIFVAAGAIALATGTMQAAASSKEHVAAKHGPVSITLWESHNGFPVGTTISAMVARFDRTHAGSVKVSIVVTKASTKLLAAIPAGTAPALAEISHYDGQYVSAGALIPWNNFIKGSSTITKQNFTPAVWENGTVNGQHYRLLANAKVSLVFYNETMFRKAGITSAPRTWTQLASDAAAIKAKDPGVIPLGWKDSSAHILPAFMSDGGTLLKGSNSVGHAVDFTSPAAVRSFTYFRSLYSAGEMQIHHGTTLREDFGAGKMAMIDGTSAGYVKALTAVGGKFKVGAFVEPAGTTGHAANIAQGLGFVLPKGHTKAQDRAAATFVEWWFQPSQQVFFAEHTGYPPETRAGVRAMPSSFLKTHPGEVATIQAILSPYTVPRPISDTYAEVQAALDSAWYNAVTGRQSVKAALQTLQKQGDGYMSGASQI